MGFWRGVSRTFLSPVVNFSRYIGVRRVAEGAGLLAGLIKWLFTPVKAQRQETFAEAQERLKLSEEDLLLRAQEFKRILWILLPVVISALLYTIYLFLHRYFLGGLAAAALTFLAASVAFKYHFWLFQLKQRRLGCTFSEWFRQGLLRLAK